MGRINYNRYKISIIIPVYNAEAYLKECILSISHQKHSNYEVIFVDDGSIDNSFEIIKKQSLLDHRYKYIKILNHGPAYARNIALDYISGDFVLFLDDDDLLAPRALSKLCRKAVQHKVDILVGNVLCFNSQTSYLYRNLNEYTGKKITGTDYFITAINSDKFTVMLYSYFYKASFIKEKKLKFDHNIIHEDELWTPIALIAANRVITTDIIHYYYRQREKSLSNTITQKQWIHDLEYITRKLRSIISETENRSLKEILYQRIKLLTDYVKNKQE